MTKKMYKPNKKVQHTVDDLRAFERRFTEVISAYEPQAKRWRFVFTFVILLVICGFFFWVFDEETYKISLFDSLIYNHPLFTGALITLGVLLFFGYQNMVVAPEIISERMRGVLRDYNLSCDDNGKIILKPVREA